NRPHVDDAVSGLFASTARPHPGRAYTLCDDEPVPADAVIEWAAARLRLPRPPEVELDDPSVSDGLRRFYRDSKRLSNARAKGELGWRPRYPTWREGLGVMLADADTYSTPAQSISGDTSVTLVAATSATSGQARHCPPSPSSSGLTRGSDVGASCAFEMARRARPRPCHRAPDGLILGSSPRMTDRPGRFPRTAGCSAGGCRPWCRRWRRGAG